MDTYIGYLTTTIDVTQRSAETIGEAFKTVFSRLGNVKVGKFTASQEDMASEDYEYHYFNQFAEYVRFDPDVYVIDPCSGLP